MAKKHSIVVGLDIGTSKVCAVVGELSADNTLNVVGLGQARSRGVRKGELADPQMAEEDIRHAIVEAEQMADLGLAIQRAEEKTEDMKARASAVDELEKAGTFEDLTQLGSGGSDDIDRQLAQLSAGTQVDDELAKMKAELGTGTGAGEKKEIEQ